MTPPDKGLGYLVEQAEFMLGCYTPGTTFNVIQVRDFVRSLLLDNEAEMMERLGLGPKVTCGECQGGLIEVNRCTCGAGLPPHGHEPLCGTEPCPNDCWYVLHPTAPGAPKVPCDHTWQDVLRDLLPEQLETLVTDLKMLKVACHFVGDEKRAAKLHRFLQLLQDETTRRTAAALLMPYEPVYEYVIFTGGPDPDNCSAIWTPIRDEAMAADMASHLDEGGYARREIRPGEWEVNWEGKNAS